MFTSSYSDLSVLSLILFTRGLKCACELWPCFNGDNKPSTVPEFGPLNWGQFVPNRGVGRGGLDSFPSPNSYFGVCNSSFGLREGGGWKTRVVTDYQRGARITSGERFPLEGWLR